MHETSEEEVSRLIENLSDNKPIQHGDIKTKFIKLSKLILAPFLTRIFNRCMNEGTYPNCFKMYQIIPIHKSGDQMRCNNYRPISILRQFNKIVEKFLHTLEKMWRTCGQRAACGPQMNFVWPAKHSGETSFLLMNNFCFCWWTIFFVFNRFHSMTKKLCGPFTQRYLTKWPTIANTFVTPALEQGCTTFSLLPAA